MRPKFPKLYSHHSVPVNASNSAVHQKHVVPSDLPPAGRSPIIPQCLKPFGSNASGAPKPWPASIPSRGKSFRSILRSHSFRKTCTAAWKAVAPASRRQSSGRPAHCRASKMLALLFHQNSSLASRSSSLWSKTKPPPASRRLRVISARHPPVPGRIF